jgi:hypothetical protein
MKKNIKPLFSISLAALLLMACTKNKCSDSVKGELKDLSGLDGCEFVIELENGNKLEPLNLSEFNIALNDGKKVWISYHLTTNMIGAACMVGDIIEIDCIANR